MAIVSSDMLRRSVVAVLSALVITALAPSMAAASGATGISTTPSIVVPTTTTPSTAPAQTGPVTVAPATSSPSSGGITGTEEIAIFVAAALLLFGIWRIIMSDARRHTPSRSLPDWERAKGSVRPIEQRIQRSRAKAKRARRARRAGR